MGSGAGAVRTYYLTDGSQPVVEMDSTGAVVKAVNTLGANGLLSRNVPGGTNAFYTFDPQGSVCQRFDRTANLLSSDEYDAYGALLGTTQSGAHDVFGYGAQWGYYTDPETGLLLLTNRYYDPGTARFLTRDPLGAAGGLNLYGYCGNNPSSYADPLGLVSRDQYVANGAAFGGAVAVTVGWESTPVGVVVLTAALSTIGGQVGGSLYDSAEDFGLAVGCYEGGQASLGQVIWSGVKGSVNVGLTAVFLRAIAAGASPGPARSAPPPVGPAKAPLDAVPYDPHPLAAPLTAEVEPGDYVYVRDTEGTVHIAPDGDHMHPKVLGGGRPATGAGTLTIAPGGGRDQVGQHLRNIPVRPRDAPGCGRRHRKAGAEGCARSYPPVPLVKPCLQQK